MRARTIGIVAAVVVVVMAACVVAIRVLFPGAPRLRPAVVVSASLPGAQPPEVERTMTIPLEVALASVPFVTAQSSTSSFGTATVRMELGPDANELAVRSAVMERIAAVQLPSGATPELGPSGTRTLTYVLVPAPETDLVALRSSADWDVERLMRMLPGVSGVTTCGGRERRIEVRLDTARLGAWGVDPMEVVAQLERSSSGPPGVVRGTGTFSDLDALRTLLVGKETDPAHPRLRDVAVIAEGAKPPTCIATDGAHEVAISEVTLVPDADVKQVAAAVNDTLSSLGGRLRARLVPLEMEARPETVHVRAWIPRTESDALAAQVRGLPEASEIFSRNTDDVTELLVRAAPKSSSKKLARAIANALEQKRIAFDLESRAVALPTELRAARIHVAGSDLEALRNAARDLAAALHEIPGVGPAVAPDARLTPTRMVVPDRDRMARHGMSFDDVTRALPLFTGGLVAGAYLEGDRRVDIVLMLGGANPETTGDLQSAKLTTQAGKLVPLSEVALVKAEPVPARISRSAGTRGIDVFFHAHDRAAFDAAKRAVSSVPLPAGTSVTLAHEGD